MNIAILGTRGIPANYSGLEVCVEETGVRLAQQGHYVTVYCRPRNQEQHPATYRGVHLVWLPAPRSKHGETIMHTLLSVLHVLLHCDRSTIVHLYGVGNAPFIVLLRLLGYRVVISVDGQDWRRAKWGRIASTYLRSCAGLAANLAAACIADSRVVEHFYRERWPQGHIVYLPYGHTQEAPNASLGVFERLGIAPGEYLLFVGRLVPEKGVHYLLEAYRRLQTTKKLVIVGATQDPAYDTQLHALASEGVVFSGPLYGADVALLYQRAYLYIHPSDVDGTSHALLTALGSGRTVLVSDIPENLETMGGTGFSFHHGDVDDLTRQLERLLPQPQLLAQVGAAAHQRVEQHYNWDRITSTLLAIYDLRFTIYD